MPVSQNRINVSIYFLVPAIFLVLLWVGDSSFINDEALILNLAIKANSNREILALGLMGTRGFQYGYAPILFYRFLLLLSDNIFVISYIKFFSIAALNSFGMYKLFRMFENWDKSSLLFFSLSPFIWFYTRNLWDNSLNITIILFSLLFYLNFLHKKSMSSLFITAFFLSLAFQTHLMSIPFILAILVHFLLTQIYWIKTHLRNVSLIFLTAFIITLPYLKYLYLTPRMPHAGGFTGSIRSFFYSFYGTGLFSFSNFSYILGKDFFSLSRWTPLLAKFSNVFFVITGWVIFLGAYGIYKSCRNLIRHKFKEFSLEMHLTFICLLTFAFTTLVFFSSGIHSNPHYFNAAWIVYFCFLAIAVNALIHLKFFRYLIYAHHCYTFIILFAVIVSIHLREGTRSLHYGPTLNSQVIIAKKLNSNSIDDNWISNADHPKFFPHTINLLRKMQPAKSEPVVQNMRNATIVYANENIQSGALEILFSN